MPFFTSLVLAYLAGAATVLLVLFLWGACWVSGDQDDHDPFEQ